MFINLEKNTYIYTYVCVSWCIQKIKLGMIKTCINMYLDMVCLGCTQGITVGCSQGTNWDASTSIQGWRSVSLEHRYGKLGESRPQRSSGLVMCKLPKWDIYAPGLTYGHTMNIHRNMPWNKFSEKKMDMQRLYAKHCDTLYFVCRL
jgi:hypothetical protein